MFVFIAFQTLIAIMVGYGEPSEGDIGRLWHSLKDNSFSDFLEPSPLPGVGVRWRSIHHRSLCRAKGFVRRHRICRRYPADSLLRSFAHIITSGMQCIFGERERSNTIVLYYLSTENLR